MDNTTPNNQSNSIPTSTNPLIRALWEKYISYRDKTVDLENTKIYHSTLLKEQGKIARLNEDASASAITNDRRFVYEELAKDRLFTIGTALRSAYVVVLVLYLYYGPFIKNEWKTATGWIIPSILIILPFILNYVVIALRIFYNKILWLISNEITRNVYV